MGIIYFFPILLPQIPQIALKSSLEMSTTSEKRFEEDSFFLKKHIISTEEKSCLSHINDFTCSQYMKGSSIKIPNIL